ncbi:MAG TPA: hypothetical protein VFW33_14940 [Gemmataceae bacterium]|nr:hypothetical protein [Gemmataceae bacterium]
MTTLLTLTLAVVISGDPDTPRKANPLAPSLPLLTDEEEDKLDAVIDRFIKADVGELRGDDYKKALQEFDKIGPEGIPALIRGLNRAATIEGSCPAVVIAKKLAKMLNSSEDRELLQFARENIGAGVGRTRHSGVLAELRVACAVRSTSLARAAKTRPATPAAPATDKTLRTMSAGDLAKAAGTERGARLKEVLTELETRRCEEAITALGAAAGSYEKDVRDLARGLLDKNLVRQGVRVIKERTKDDRAEVRWSAARVIGGKSLKLGDELIDLLGDDYADVREAAHAALVKLGKGADYGPAKDASAEERAAAVKKWRAWWEKQEKR